MGAAPSIRARVRAELTDEIKAAARRRLAEEGANLSLRAVARDLGMVSSALYRYFRSRDELLTALIVDAYDALGSQVEQADAAVPDRADLRQRWLACARAVRQWALAHPSEYALLYGSPVPGYTAPSDTVPAATRVGRVLLGILADGIASGAVGTPPEPAGVGAGSGTQLPEPVRRDLARLPTTTGTEPVEPIPEELLARAVTAWLQLFGTVSFELFGHLDDVINAREAYFDHQLHFMADLLGLPALRSR